MVNTVLSAKSAHVGPYPFKVGDSVRVRHGIRGGRYHGYNEGDVGVVQSYQSVDADWYGYAVRVRFDTPTKLGAPRSNYIVGVDELELADGQEQGLI